MLKGLKSEKINVDSLELFNDLTIHQRRARRAAFLPRQLVN